MKAKTISTKTHATNGHAVKAKSNGNGKHTVKKSKKSKLTGYNPEFLKANDWHQISGAPKDASVRAKKLLSLAFHSKDTHVFRKDNMLRVRYGTGESALSLFTVRAITKETPTVTITPRLRDEKFSERFKGTDAKAWKPTGKPPFDAELRYVGEDTKLVARLQKILPVMLDKAKNT